MFGLSFEIKLYIELLLYIVAIVTNVLKLECVNTGNKSEIGNVACWSKD